MNNKTTRLTYEEADAIFMASQFADQFDEAYTGDLPDGNEDGFLYYLLDGSMVTVGHDGKVTHEHEGRPGMDATPQAAPAARITQEAADLIFRASEFFAELDDTCLDPDGEAEGYLYILNDGSAVLVDWAGNLSHPA